MFPVNRFSGRFGSSIDMFVAQSQIINLDQLLGENPSPARKFAVMTYKSFLSSDSTFLQRKKLLQAAIIEEVKVEAWIEHKKLIIRSLALDDSNQPENKIEAFSNKPQEEYLRLLFEEEEKLIQELELNIEYAVSLAEHPNGLFNE